MSHHARSALLALAVVTALAAPPRADALPPIIPLSQVRPGQRAVAKSVFRGTRIEVFHVEIIGVLHKYDGTRSIILGQILDGPVVERKSGVIAGMSGSPVYIDGRLAGAIALTWAWSKEPVAGITPIEEMLEAWQTAPAPARETSSSASALSLPVTVGGKRITRVQVAGTPPDRPDPPGVMTLIPLGGFVQVSGFGRRGIEQLSELMAPYGVHVIQGPGGGEAAKLRPPMVPGAALGAQLMRGDFDMSALGTVTLVEGDRVLGFGHPLFQLGAIDVPMTGGYVYDILPSLYVSNKIMAATQVVGRVTQDVQTAIGGTLGAPADMLPVTIEVRDKTLGRKRTFHVEVARVREMLPALVASSVMTAVDEARGRVRRGTVRTALRVEVEGRPPIEREDLGYSGSDAAAAASPLVLQALALLSENPFERLHARSVLLRVEVEDERLTASIERVTVAQSRITAGDVVTLNVRVRPYGAAPVDIPVKLRIPADLPQGQVRVAVTAGPSADDARNAIGAPLPTPISVNQLIERFAAQEPGCNLVVYAALPQPGASMLGEELPSLPQSALDALRATQPTDLRPLPSVLKVVTPTNWVLTGQQMVTLRVESRLPPSGRKAPEAPPEAPSEEGQKEAAARGPEGGAQFAAIVPRLAAGPAPKQAAKGEENKEEEKPPTRGPEAWVQRSPTDYRRAELKGTALCEDGSLRLALKRTDVAQLPASVAWSIAARGGAIYVGTGERGVIYRVGESGTPEEFFVADDMNVNSLVFDAEGNLYAGTSPRGRLYAIAPDGTGRLIFDSDSTYLWALAVGPDGTLYAGGGAPARVYAIGKDGRARVLAELPASNALSLLVGAGGEIYAGTSEAGVVYRILPDGSATAICQVDGQSVDALALGRGGELYASSSPGGQVFVIPRNGLPSVYANTGQAAIYALGVLPNGDLVAATGRDGAVVRVTPDGKSHIEFRPEAGVATAMAVVDGVAYVGSSGPCTVRTFGPGLAESGAVESEVLDAGRAARWGRITWTAETPKGTSVSAQTRSGDSPDPERGWTPWAPVIDGYVLSPPARYLQYRLTLGTTAPAETPIVRQVRVSREAENQAPACSLKTPEAGSYLAGKVSVTWQARDPDKDTLTFGLDLSSDGGKTYEDLKHDLTEPKYEWDTKQTKDGRYLLRLTASDRRSSPRNPKEARDVAAVCVDNTPPEVMFFWSTLSVGEDRRVRVSALATDALSPIRSAEYRVDGGDWETLALQVVESPVADIVVETPALEAGKRVLEVRVFDAAGNQASDKIEVAIPRAEHEGGGETGSA